VAPTPALSPDGHSLYVGNGGGTFTALTTGGVPKWTFQTGGPYPYVLASAAVGGDGTIYFGAGSDFTFYALNPNGTMKWRYAGDSYFRASPAIGADGTVYAASGFGDTTIYAFGPGNGVATGGEAD
jgi:outer membrane protein assembly factor BamB